MNTNAPGGDTTPDTVQRRQFAVVPMWVHRKILATGTRTMALAVYVELVGRYAGSAEDAEGLRVWPQVQQIADSMGVPKSSVERALKVLIRCEVVLKKRTVRRNQYWLPQEPPGEFVKTLADFQSVTSDVLDKVQTVTSDGPETVTTDGLRTVTSDGLYNPDPSIQTQETQSLSPPPSPKLPAVPAPAASNSDERETDASPSKPKPTTAQRVVRAAAVLAEGEDETAFIAWLTARHNPGGPAWWRTVAANGDFGDLAADWRAESAPSAAVPAGRVLPPWCGRCDGEPVAERWRDGEDGRAYRCPDCHPDVAPTWAAPSTVPVRRGGHVPFQCPTDQSLYDLGFDGRPLSTADKRTGQAFAVAAELAEEGRPLPGTDTTVAGWAAVARQLDDGG